MLYDNQLLIAVLTREASNWDFIDTFNRLEKPPGTLIIHEKGHHISRARNDAVQDFLETDRKYLMFIDDDLIFIRTDLIYRLLDWDKDLTSGLYYNRRPPFHPLMLFKEGNTLGYKYMHEDYPRDQLIEVDGCGAGLLLIKREVFNHVGPPWFQVHDEWQPNKRVVWGEDIEFCVKAKQAGLKIYVDTGAIALHIAQIPIGPEPLLYQWWKQKGSE